MKYCLLFAASLLICAPALRSAEREDFQRIAADYRALYRTLAHDAENLIGQVGKQKEDLTAKLDPESKRIYDTRFTVASEWSEHLLKYADEMDRALEKKDYYLFIDQLVAFQTVLGQVTTYTSVMGALEAAQKPQKAANGITKAAMQLEIGSMHLGIVEFQRLYGRLSLVEEKR